MHQCIWCGQACANDVDFVEHMAAHMRGELPCLPTSTGHLPIPTQQQWSLEANTPTGITKDGDNCVATPPQPAGGRPEEVNVEHPMSTPLYSTPVDMSVTGVGEVGRQCRRPESPVHSASSPEPALGQSDEENVSSGGDEPDEQECGEAGEGVNQDWQMPYKCSVCSLTTATAASLRRHVKTHTDSFGSPAPRVEGGRPAAVGGAMGGRPVYRCSQCQKKYLHAGSLKKHLLSHRVQSGHDLGDMDMDGLHPCKLCKKVYTRPDKLQTHRLTHTGDKPFRCSHCEKSFWLEQQLQAHIKLKCSGTRKLPSRTELAFVAKKPRTATQHILSYQEEDEKEAEEEHLEPQSTVSEVSEQDSTTEESPPALKVRTVRTHRKKKIPTATRDEDKSFICEVCGKAFHSNNHLKRHAEIHTGKAKYQCTLCLRYLNRKDQLKKHIGGRRCKPRKPPPAPLPESPVIPVCQEMYRCSVCKEMFPSKDKYLEHKTTHVNHTGPATEGARLPRPRTASQDDGRVYPCPTCLMVFEDQTVLNKHYQVHTGQKCFRCTFCKKQFSHQRGLLFHMVNSCRKRPINFQLEELIKEAIEDEPSPTQDQRQPQLAYGPAPITPLQPEPILPPGSLSSMLPSPSPPVVPGTTAGFSQLCYNYQSHYGELPTGSDPQYGLPRDGQSAPMQHDNYSAPGDGHYPYKTAHSQNPSIQTGAVFDPALYQATSTHNTHNAVNLSVTTQNFSQNTPSLATQSLSVFPKTSANLAQNIQKSTATTSSSLHHISKLSQNTSAISHGNRFLDLPEAASMHSVDQSEEEQKTPMECPTCGTSFKQIYYFIKHFETSKCSKLGGVVKCKVCGDKTVPFEDYVRHVRCHDGLDTFTCPLCYRMYTSSLRFEKHKHKCVKFMKTMGYDMPQITKEEIHKQLDPPITTSPEVVSGRHGDLVHVPMKDVERRVGQVVLPDTLAVMDSLTKNSKLPPLSNMHASANWDGRRLATPDKNSKPSLGKTGPTELINGICSYENNSSWYEVGPGEHYGFRCRYDHCEAILSSKYHLMRHMRSVHTSEEKVICEICKKTYSSKHSLNTHMLTHSKEKQHKCSYCNTKFRLMATLKRHERRHTGERPHQCPICTHRFIDISELNRHITAHNVPNPFTCAICGQAFPRKKMLIYHVKVHRGPRKPKAVHGCSLCGKRFTSKRSAVFHMRTHTGEKPYECEFCHERFTWVSSYHRHVGQHIGKVYGCPICQKNFGSMPGLKEHMIGHSDKKDFSCHLCGKEFAKKKCWKQHLRVHEGKKHLCKECGSAFSEVYYLNRHMKTHTASNNHSQLVSHAAPTNHSQQVSHAALTNHTTLVTHVAPTNHTSHLNHTAPTNHVAHVSPAAPHNHTAIGSHNAPMNSTQILTPATRTNHPLHVTHAALMNRTPHGSHVSSTNHMALGSHTAPSNHTPLMSHVAPMTHTPLMSHATAANLTPLMSYSTVTNHQSFLAHASTASHPSLFRHSAAFNHPSLISHAAALSHIPLVPHDAANHSPLLSHTAPINHCDMPLTM